MNILTADEIRLHLCSGQKHTYHHEGISLHHGIHDDLDPDIFRRQNLIQDESKVVSHYPGKEVIGVMIRPTWPFDFFFERERSLGIIVTEIGSESTNRTPHDVVQEAQQQVRAAKPILDRRTSIFTELEFDSGIKVFLEFSQFPEKGIDELAVINHIFSHSSLSCRRLGGGISIWNTDHILQWTNYPQLDVQQEIGATSDQRDTNFCSAAGESLQLI